MSFIYIIGPAGSGKSAITLALQEKGFLAFDEDDPAVGSAHNKITNNSVMVPSALDRTSDWFDKHEWRVLDSAMQNMLKLSEDDTVILLGNCYENINPENIFDKVIYLNVSADILQARIAHRIGNDFGKNADEMQIILKRKSNTDVIFLNSGVEIINADQSLEDVVNDTVACII